MQKRNKIIKNIVLVCLFLIIISLYSITFAANDFNTDSRNSSRGTSSDQKGILYLSTTGTRYAIRVGGKDISGSFPAYCYWVEERDSKNKYYINGVKYESPLFDRSADVESHNIVYKWKLVEGTPDTSNFGLDATNIKRLVDTIAAEAQRLGDATALALIAQIQSGTPFEIRADILMKMVLRTSTDVSGVIAQEEMYLPFSCSANGEMKSFMTYRECQALGRWLDANNFGGVRENDHTYKKVAEELFVLNGSGKTNWQGVNYYDEYIGSAISPDVANGRINDGFDYIYNGTYPGIPEQRLQIPSVTVKYVVIEKTTDPFSTGTTVIGPVTQLLDVNRTYSKDQINALGRNYNYVGVSLDNNPPIPDAQITVGNDGNNHEVVFAYTPIIIVRHMEKKPNYGAVLIEPRTVQVGDIVSKKDIPNYTYYSVQVNDGGESPSTSKEVFSSVDSYTITFWYIRSDTPFTKITVYYNEEVLDVTRAKKVKPISDTTDHY